MVFLHATGRSCSTRSGIKSHADGLCFVQWAYRLSTRLGNAGILLGGLMVQVNADPTTGLEEGVF